MESLSIEGIYEDQYPIIFYDPGLIKPLEDSSIHFFSQCEDALKFGSELGISFLIVIPQDYDEVELIKDLQESKSIFHRKLFAFEEEALFKGLFKEEADEISSFFKCYVFITQQDGLVDLPVKEDEEEHLLMCDVKEMTKIFRQEYIVIWYDADMNIEKKKKLVEEADIEKRNIYNNFEDLYQRLAIDSQNDPPYHLIMTGKHETKKVIDEINNLGEKLLCLYIYEEDDDEILKIIHRKIIAKKTFEELVPKIVEGIRRRSALRNTFPTFATDFDALDKTQIYRLHYYLKYFTNVRNQKQAKRDFIKLAKKVYQSPMIQKFEDEYQEYNKERIIRWYTNGSPVYKLLNNCLRIATHDSILYCRFVLRDLEWAIKEQYQESKPYNGLVYRGAYIAEEEWKKLEKSVGKEIEMYGFLSTSKNEKTAKKFLHEDLDKKAFITIIIPPLPDVTLNEQGFADIGQLSHFQNEEEILFNVRSKFKILEVGKMKLSDKGDECRHLALLYGPQLLRKYVTQKNPLVKVELKSEIIQCEICGFADKRLFAFSQKEFGTQVRCIDCLIKHSVPDGVPLMSVGSEKKDFRGIMLDFYHTGKYYGYKCNDCGESGKEKYYKWIKKDLVIEQCKECFENKREMKGDFLLSETVPHAFWQENQKRAEEIDTNFQMQEAKRTTFPGHVETFWHLEQFDLCKEYCQSELGFFSRKRWKEVQKLNHFYALGLVESKLKNTRKALEYNQLYLDLSKALYGEDSSQTLVAYTALGSLYGFLGEHQLALECHQRALSMKRELNGENNDFETGTLYSNVAVAYQNLGQDQQALDFYKEAIRISEAFHGENNYHMASKYNNIAGHYNKMKEYKLALEFHHKCLAIWEAVQGEQHSGTAAAYHGIALVHTSLGEDPQALEYYKKALGIFRAIYREKSHPETAAVETSIAAIWMKFGKCQEALECFRRALDMYRVVHGEKHVQTGIAHDNVGVAYEKLGDYKKALDYYHKAREIFEVEYGEYHSTTGLSYDSIGVLYEGLKNYVMALEYYHKALEVFIMSYGENHIKTASAYNSIAFAYENIKEYQKALGSYHKTLELFKVIHGEKHSQTAIAHHNVGRMYSHLKEYQMTAEYYKKALELWVEVCGENNSSAEVFYRSLAMAYERLKEDEKAVECRKKALDIKKRISGG